MANNSKFVKFTRYWPNRIQWPSSSYSKEPPVLCEGKLGEDILINVDKIYTVTRWQEPISFEPDPYKPNIKIREPEICCTLWLDKDEQNYIVVHGNLQQTLDRLNG